MTIHQQTERQSTSPPVIDYEGSQYETDFWVGRGRAYEDAVERIALRQLVPSAGRRIAEIGAAFGRLVDLYQGYDQIILLDYSRSQLQTAAKRLGSDPRYVFVAGNVYSLPFVDGILDTLVMVRVMHHLADVPHALSELKRVMHKQSTAVVEYANKRNMKALLRWWSKRQAWSPHGLEPIEFVKLNFDFHPTWMAKRLSEAEQLAVSHLLLGLLKRTMPTHLLAELDHLFFKVGGRYPISPSVFLQLQLKQAAQASQISTKSADVTSLFRCPKCFATPLQRTEEDSLLCTSCKSRYTRKLGVWDFKDPVET